jgi:excisionase family DNA binding protein
MTEKGIIEIAGKRLMRLSTFAEDMGLHIRTVQLWTKDHDMPVIRVGNQMLLDLDDIPEWLDRHKSLTKSMHSPYASSRSHETVHSGQT